MEEADKNCDVLVFIGDVQPESLTKPKTEWRHPKLHFAEYTSQKEMIRTKPDNDITNKDLARIRTATETELRHALRLML